MNRTAASATRIRQPPENDDSGRPCAASSKPRPLRIRAARAGAASAPIAASRSWISASRPGSPPSAAAASSAVRSLSAASTASSGVASPPGASCATTPIRTPACSRTLPASGCSSPAIRRSSVDLPDPLRPTSPKRWPAGTCSVAPSSSGRPAIRSVMSLRWSMAGGS